MSQLQPDIPAQLGNHTPKWGGNLSCGACSNEESMGVATIVFQGWFWKMSSSKASPRKPESAKGQSATEQQMRVGGKRVEEEGKEELSYSESRYLKIETILH